MRPPATTTSPSWKLSRTAFLAGQCPLDQTGAIVGPGDLDAQIDQVAANALAALAAARRPA
ncbi:Rid family hydrolase [Nonomuraea ferruginea]